MSFLWVKILIFRGLSVNKIFLYSSLYFVLAGKLPEIPLIAYHLIQKGTFYLLGQKIRSPYSFLAKLNLIFEKVPVLYINFEIKINLLMLNHFQWQEKMFWLSFEYNYKSKILLKKPENFGSRWKCSLKKQFK